MINYFAMKHLLLQSAYHYMKRKDVSPSSNFYYDKSVGAWLGVFDKEPLIHTEDFPHHGTKKYDVETGEDHKGQ